jgi:hypothetical protein
MAIVHDLAPKVAARRRREALAPLLADLRVAAQVLERGGPAAASLQQLWCAALAWRARQTLMRLELLDAPHQVRAARRWWRRELRALLQQAPSNPARGFDLQHPER